MKSLNVMAIMVALLVLAVLASAVLVVYSKHESRKAFVALQTAHGERDAMSVEWSQLQLEQGLWATHGRIEQVARDELGMIRPEHASVVVVQP